MTKTPNFRVVWVEDQLDQLGPGIDEFRTLLGEKLDRSVDVQGLASLEVVTTYFQEHQSDTVDLMIMDVILPRTEKARTALPNPRVDMNAGYLLWHQIRRQVPLSVRFPNTPICVVTARARPVFRGEMEKDPFLLWLEKPIPPSEIVDSLMNKLLANINNAPEVKQ